MFGALVDSHLLGNTSFICLPCILSTATRVLVLRPTLRVPLHEDIPDLVLLINLERRPSVQSLASLHFTACPPLRWCLSMWNDYGIVATFSGNLEPRITRRSHECASTLRMKCCGSCTRLNGECGSDECTGYEQIDHRHGFAMCGP